MTDRVERMKQVKEGALDIMLRLYELNNEFDTVFPTLTDAEKEDIQKWLYTSEKFKKVMAGAANVNSMF